MYKKALPFIMFFLLFSWGHHCQARVKAYTGEASLSTGRVFFDSSAGSEDRFLGTLQVDLNLTDHFGFQLSFLNSFYSTGGVPDVTFYTFSTVWNIVPKSVLTPYLLLGGGAGTFNTDLLVNQSMFTINAGGGLKYFLDRDVAVKLDFRDYITTGDVTHNYSATLGLVYFFDFSSPGGRPEMIVSERGSEIVEAASSMEAEAAVEESGTEPSGGGAVADRVREGGAGSGAAVEGAGAVREEGFEISVAVARGEESGAGGAEVSGSGGESGAVAEGVVEGVVSDEAAEGIGAGEGEAVVAGGVSVGREGMPEVMRRAEGERGGVPVMGAGGVEVMEIAKAGSEEAVVVPEVGESAAEEGAGADITVERGEDMEGVEPVEGTGAGDAVVERVAGGARTGVAAGAAAVVPGGAAVEAAPLAGSAAEREEIAEGVSGAEEEERRDVVVGREEMPLSEAGAEMAPDSLREPVAGAEGVVVEKERGRETAVIVHRIGGGEGAVAVGSVSGEAVPERAEKVPEHEGGDGEAVAGIEPPRPVAGSMISAEGPVSATEIQKRAERTEPQAERVAERAAIVGAEEGGSEAERISVGGGDGDSAVSAGITAEMAKGVAGAAAAVPSAGAVAVAPAISMPSVEAERRAGGTGEPAEEMSVSESERTGTGEAAAVAESAERGIGEEASAVVVEAGGEMERMHPSVSGTEEDALAGGMEVESGGEAETAVAEVPVREEPSMEAEAAVEESGTEPSGGGAVADRVREGGAGSGAAVEGAGAVREEGFEISVAVARGEESGAGGAEVSGSGGESGAVAEGVVEGVVSDEAAEGIGAGEGEAVVAGGVSVGREGMPEVMRRAEGERGGVPVMGAGGVEVMEIAKAGSEEAVVVPEVGESAAEEGAGADITVERGEDMEGVEPVEGTGAGDAVVELRERTKHGEETYRAPEAGHGEMTEVPAVAALKRGETPVESQPPVTSAVRSGECDFRPSLEVLQQSADSLADVQLNVYFGFDTRRLDRNARKCIMQLVSLVGDRDAEYYLVEGHSCAHGPEAYNLRLSRKRALAVRDFLVKEGKVDADLIRVEAYGETRLLYPEVPTKENRNDEKVRANRRVEIRVRVR